MAFEITIPRLGWSMEEGTFVRWLKQEGDVVKPGEAVFELEGEKAAQDIEAVDGGILRIPPTAPKPGAVVAVGAVIGYLVEHGEAISFSIPGQASSPPTEVVPLVAAAAPAAAPSVRRMAREMGVDLARVVGSGPAGKIMAQDLQIPKPASVPPPSRTSAVASPRARRVAKELGVDWTRLAGSGRDGRVRESDVRRSAAAGGPAAAAASKWQPVVAGQTIPASRHRRTVAERMLFSQQHTAPVTLTTRVDATNLVSLRQQFKSADSRGVVPSYSDIIMKLVSMALAQHPLLMAQWAEDHLVVPDAINIGMAVDTDAGLLVPVVRNVPSLSLVELSKQASALIAQARAGQLKSSEIQGGVFTITNLGSYGIDAFTPIINYPETAILGLGRIRRDPVVYENQIVPRDQLSLSLTFDHRIVDGAPAARFLQTVGQAIETPSAWLLRNP